MLFNYTAIDKTGHETSGSIDAINEDVAISSLQRRGLVIASIVSTEDKALLKRNIVFFDRVTNKEIVILSRQIATLFEAQVSALRVFKLLGTESDNRMLKVALTEVVDDLQSGSTISKALGKHKKIFSPFYVNMVKAGEESGKLDQTFSYLADYLDRTYEITSKAKNALIYPAFVVFTFITVMILMLTLVIPRISSIFLESGQDLPIYTKIVIGLSDFFVNYGIFLFILIIIGGFFVWKFSKTKNGRISVSHMKLSLPYLGGLYKKLYLSRISDNLSTMLSSGIPMVRAVEITANVVGDAVYEKLLIESMGDIKAGSPVSESLAKYPEIPNIMVQMIKVGEETGELGKILNTLSKFYSREVRNTVDTLITLIEPILIVTLALGVGILLASVLMPIYNISAGI
ncbi:MAG: type II secretion system F family protein [Candidatus Pacebacteria bacterium]|jgi:type IV pilus assembly protein PilC|nr:type II secretion system F family protein [Candidatus Paceibacterota bacterium]|tara:strand:+ start:33880 stop:35085 length:1206 start_codon:yes stop_codon:yes gene_type:complete